MHRHTFEFSTGPLVGKTIRVDLREIQKPHINRKTSTPMVDRVDRIERRPLDPPPVVSARILEVSNEGQPNETSREIDASSSIAYSGFVCHVDLFPVSPPSNYRGPIPQRQWSSDSVIKWPRPTYEDPTDASELSSQRQAIEQEEQALEKRRMTSKLFGCSFVNAVPIKDLQGNPIAVFVFADLSCRVEGHFVLRYRCFDVFSTIQAGESIPVCAETWGGPFVVVGTKEFPGLKASTELTKHLASYGIPVNWRGYGRSQKQLFGPRDDDDDDDEHEGGLSAGPAGVQRSLGPPLSRSNSYPSLPAHAPLAAVDKEDPEASLQPLGYNPTVRSGFTGYRPSESDPTSRRSPD